MPSDLPTLDPDVLAQVVGALVVMTPEGEIVSWDRGAEILFGFSPAEALRRSIFDLVIPPDRAAETREQIQKALAIGAAVYESERSRKDGSSLPVAVTLRPVKGEDGRTLIATNDRDNWIIRGLSKVLAQPADVPELLGDVLVHCLDAAGLSTGLLYMADAD